MSEPSGPQWCPRFPGSTSPADLLPDFRDDVRAFISQMQDGGASVTISATFRPPQRAYLMHWCWLIAREGADPASVPPMAGVAIDWTHDANDSAARAAAEAMVLGYAIRFEPSLTSRHTERRAIDMTVAWQGALTLTDFNGQRRVIASTPRDGTNPDLAAVGKTFGVIKLAADPPHWSDDGH